PRADTGTIGLYADRPYLDPVILEGALAAQELRNIVGAVHQNIQQAVIIEITDGAPASCNLFQHPGPGVGRYVRKPSISEILVHNLALTVARLDLGLGNFRINMTVGHEDVGPSIVVEVQKAHTPTEEPRILPQASLKGPVFEE